jgi:hypothetical protein
LRWTITKSERLRGNLGAGAPILSSLLLGRLVDLDQIPARNRKDRNFCRAGIGRSHGKLHAFIFQTLCFRDGRAGPLKFNHIAFRRPIPLQSRVDVED